MNALLYCACAVLVVGIIGGHVLQDRAWKLLTAEERVRETDALSGIRTLGVLLYVAFYGSSWVLGVYSVTVTNQVVRAWIVPAVFGFSLLAVGCYQLYVHWRVRALVMPRSYRTALSWSHALSDVAAAVVCALIAVSIYG